MTYDGHPDIRTKKQVTVKVTEQFAKDLNLIMASHRMTDVSQAIRYVAGLHADYIRSRYYRKTAALEAADKES